MIIIYLVKNKIDGKVYIGKTSQKLRRRWSHHVSHASKDQYYFHRAISKYGADVFEVSEIDQTEDLATANILEQKYIQEFKSFDPEFGYNATFGGDGVPCTPEAKEKHRQSMIGKPKSLEARRKQSLSVTGEKNPVYGRPVSEETRQKRSLALKGRPRPKEVMDRIVATRMLNGILKTVAWG
jgi:group I intron endonuclease